MADALQTAVVNAALHIFETMFFIFLEPLEGGFPLLATTRPPETEEEETGFSPALEAGWLLTSEIAFEGPRSGTLRIRLPWELGELMTRNFLGFEDEVTDGQVEDMGCELVNMICGNFLSLFDKQSVFTMGSPQSAKLPASAPPPLPRAGEQTFDFSTEGFPVRILLHLAEGASG